MDSVDAGMSNGQQRRQQQHHHRSPSDSPGEGLQIQESDEDDGGGGDDGDNQNSGDNKSGGQVSQNLRMLRKREAMMAAKAAEAKEKTAGTCMLPLKRLKMAPLAPPPSSSSSTSSSTITMAPPKEGSAAEASRHRYPPPSSSAASDPVTAMSSWQQQQQRQHQQQQSSSPAASHSSGDLSPPYVEILEQPASHQMRFRYECESQGRSIGSLQGEFSTPEEKTYPRIAIRGYSGDAIVVVSCVTSEKPYKAHPHKLIWKDATKNDKGVCSASISPGPAPDNGKMQCEFRGLAIECVKKSQVALSLAERQANRVDPFKQGFAHGADELDLMSVRLCFQVFLPQPGRPPKMLQPVVSRVIRDRKKFCSLAITDLSTNSVPASGGVKVILLCNRVFKEDLRVKICEADQDDNSDAAGSSSAAPSPNAAWETVVAEVKVGRFGGMSFTAPPYKDPNITVPVFCHLYFERPSDQKVSDKVTLMYVPDNQKEGGGGHRALVENGGLNPAHKETEAWWSKKVLDLKMSLKNERVKSVEQTESALKEQGEAFKAERQALEAEVARFRNEVQKLQASNKHLLIQQQIQQQQQKQLELELRQSGGGGGGSSADSLREVVNAAISLEFQRQRDRDYNSRQVDLLPRSEERVPVQEAMALQADNNTLALAVQDLRATLAAQQKGIDNMNWQLEHKTKQVVELEQRLRETFPVMVATSAAMAAAPSAAARLSLSLPPSLATMGSHEPAAVMQAPHQQQLIPVEPRLLARSVSYSFPTSSTMAIRSRSPPGLSPNAAPAAAVISSAAAGAGAPAALVPPIFTIAEDDDDDLIADRVDIRNRGRPTPPQDPMYGGK